MSLLAALIAAAQLAIGTVTLKPADFLDGRAIAGGDGMPVVMLTLSPASAKRVAALPVDAVVMLDGKPVAVRRVDATIEIDGLASFDVAVATARAITGKPPLPETTEQ